MDKNLSIKLTIDAKGNVKGVAGESVRELKKLDTQAGKTSKSIDGMSSAVKVFGGALAGIGVFQVAKYAITTADSFNILQQRIKTATKATGDYAAVSAELYSISQKTGTALESNVVLFQSLARVAPEIGATNKQMLSLTKTLQQLGTIGGSTNEQMANAMLQFGQAMAGGVMRAEEFNSIVENTPEIAARIAEGMGMTVGELRMAVLEGSVLSDEVFSALISQTQEINNEFSRLAPTIDRATTMFANSIDRALGAADNSMSFTQQLALGLQGWSMWMDSINPQMTEHERINIRIMKLRQEINEGASLFGQTTFQILEKQKELKELEEKRLVIWQQMDEAKAKASDNAKAEAAVKSIEDENASLDDLLDKYESEQKWNELRWQSTKSFRDKQKKAIEDVIKLQNKLLDAQLDEADKQQKAMHDSWADHQESKYQIALDKQYAMDLLELDREDAFERHLETLAEAEREHLEQRTKEYEQMVERIDGVFVDVWRDVIDGTDNAFDAISNMFKQLLAEMAHQAITKPIMISVMGSVGLTPANTASAVMGNSGSFGLDSIGSFFTGGDLFSGSIGSAAASAIGYTMGYGGVAAGSQAAMLASQTAAFGTAGSSLTAGAAGASSAGLGSSFMAAAPYIAGFLALDALMGGKITSGIVTGITGGDWEYRDHGMTLDASRSGVDADSYLYERKDGGWFRSSRGRTTYSDMPEFEAAYSLVVKGMLDQLDANANDLGYDLADNFSTTFKTSFKNMDDAEIEQAIADSLTSVYRDAVESIAGLSDYLDDFQYSGEELYQTLARVTQQTHAVSDLLGLTNQEFGSVTSRVFDFSSGYIKGLINWAQNPVWKTVAADANLVAQNLIELSGGLDALSASTATYYQAFFTEEEKFTRLTSDLTTALSAQNLALPATREEYRALLESLNLGGEAAQAQYVALLQLSGVADGYYSEIEAREAELNEQRLAAIEEQAALELAAIEAQTDALNGLMDALNDVYGDVISSTSVNASDYMQAQGALASAVAMAQAGQAVSVSDIESALSVVSNNDIANYASRLDYERDQLITAGYISQLSGLLDGNIGLINGSHATGLASVPFDGYIAQTHKDESIIDARTMQGLRRYGVPVQQSNNRELVQELKRLQELVKQMGNQMHKDNAQVISISDRTSRLLKKFDVDGMPEVRNV